MNFPTLFTRSRNHNRRSIFKLAATPSAGTRYQEVRAAADLGLWSPVQWKLVWLADNYVLGRRGIRPHYDNNPVADDAWEDYMVDPAGQHNPREFQRVVLACLIADGEAFVERVGGKFMPVGAPAEIRYDDNKNPNTPNLSLIHI